MDMPAKNVTNDRLYDAITNTRLELKADISDIRHQFESLETGRLTRLETKITEFEINQIKRDSALKQNQAVLSTKFLVLMGIGNIILTAFIAYIIKRVFG